MLYSHFLLFLLVHGCSAQRQYIIQREENTVTFVNASCSEVLPIHATVTASSSSSCTWTCNEGYFTTQTAFPTCKACANPLYFACDYGYELKHCTKTTDTACAPCPDRQYLKYPQEYSIPGNCSLKTCSPGFVSAYNKEGKLTSCTKCPENYWCPGGDQSVEPRPCQGNCTTLGKDTCTSSLQCSLADPSQGNHVAVTVQFTIYVAAFYLSSVNLPIDMRCPALDNALYFLLDIGIALESSIRLTSLASYIHIISSIVIPECARADAYTEWLKKKLSTDFKDIEKAILFCVTQRPNTTTSSSRIYLNSPLVSAATSPSSNIPGELYYLILEKIANPLEWKLPPEVVPSSRQKNIAWGKKNKTEVLYYVAAVSIVVLCALLAFIVALHTCFFQWRASKINRKLFRDVKKKIQQQTA